MQLGAHTQLEVARVPQGEMTEGGEAGFREVKRNYPTISRRHGDRKEGPKLLNGTNESTNINYIREKCNYRTVYSIFVDVDPSISSQDCD
jgi:hypothetical protein